MRTLFLAAALALTAGSAPATPPIIDRPPPAPPPRLAVVISVEGMTTEMLDRYRSDLHGGLARMLTGAQFRNVAAAESLQPLKIGDILQERNAGSLTVAVAGDRAGAVKLSGQGPDQRWYWQGDRFATDLGAPVPMVIGQANSAIQSMVATAQPPLVPPPNCASSAGTVPANRFARAGNDVASFESSPAMDGAVLALTAALVKGLGLGNDVSPDFVAASLPATARVAARNGAASEANCLQILSLDRDLKGFFDLLDRDGRDYSVVLMGSSTNGSAAPLLFWRKGLPSTVRNERVRAADIDRTIATQLGISKLQETLPGNCLEGISGIACVPR